jgi:hypothetical protein
MTQKHTRILNNTLLPLNAVILLNGNPVDLSAYTVKFLMETDTGTSVLSETATGVTAHPTQTFTAEADDEYLTCRAHGVKEGDQIIVANSGGALPTGLSASTPYFAIQVTPNKFQLATLPGGAAINLTTDGTGTNTFYIVGSVQYDFAAATVDEAGLFRGWFTITSSTEYHHFPDDEYGIPIEIKNVGN